MSAATYTFKAVDAAGTPEKGEISGVSREAVTAELKARGLTVMDLVEKKTGLKHGDLARPEEGQGRRS